jgi:hypothetical protein
MSVSISFLFYFDMVALLIIPTILPIFPTLVFRFRVLLYASYRRGVVWRSNLPDEQHPPN